jgi:hypothetical protein
MIKAHGHLALLMFTTFANDAKAISRRATPTSLQRSITP